MEDLTEQVAARDKIAQQQLELEQLNASLAQKVQERTAHLQRANQRLEELAYALAHDLNAPLATADGFLSALHARIEGTDDSRSLHFVARARAGIAQARTMTEAWIQLANVAHRKLVLQDVDTAGIVHRWRANHGSDPRLELDVEGLPTVRGDLRLLSLTLEELLGNAIKFSAGSARPRVRVTSAQRGGERVFAVRDNGVGFHPLGAGRLFKPFQRLHEADAFAGLGMGLAKVHEAVARHGGRCWGSSPPTGGAEFCFALPAPGASITPAA